jgi:hypothetical protein
MPTKIKVPFSSKDKAKAWEAWRHGKIKRETKSIQFPLFGGAAENRTLVQRNGRRTFYMLS